MLFVIRKPLNSLRRSPLRHGSLNPKSRHPKWREQSGCAEGASLTRFRVQLCRGLFPEKPLGFLMRWDLFIFGPETQISEILRQASDTEKPRTRGPGRPARKPPVSECGGGIRNPEPRKLRRHKISGLSQARSTHEVSALPL